MSDSTSRLPARPSLEQLRKQAKELLRDFRAGDTAAVGRLGAVIPRLTDPARSDDVILADAQFALAREYGFENWAGLIRQVEVIASSSRREEFEQIANDLFSAYHGDPDALRRMGNISDAMCRWKNCASVRRIACPRCLTRRAALPTSVSPTRRGPSPAFMASRVGQSWRRAFRSRRTTHVPPHSA